MPSLPQPVFASDTWKNQESNNGQINDDVNLIEESKFRNQPASKEGGLIGPWDHSRSLKEGEMNVGNVVRPPAVAANLPRL
jgi:hypothetical protein